MHEIMSNKKNSSKKTVIKKMDNKKIQKKEYRSKKNIIVAVRMPKGLIEELKDLQKINHFMDLSDEIRFVIRKYSTVSSNNENAANINNKIELQKKEQLIADLSKIIEGLKNNAN